MRRIGSTPAERGSTGQNNCPDVIELDRVGSAPAERGSATGQSCPDVLVGQGGDFLVIGYRARREMRDLDEKLAAVGAGINQATETAVIVPRDCILAAAKQLAAEGLAG
ncbi:hypothetical protein [Streptomyces mirabilis]|uniref:hypothetical protein n=1 Tax=Streptomyces mirabilis TaxID=68239 RepID=UPI00368CD5CB